jgi:hypothetical protein
LKAPKEIGECLNDWKTLSADSDIKRTKENKAVVAAVTEAWERIATWPLSAFWEFLGKGATSDEVRRERLVRLISAIDHAMYGPDVRWRHDLSPAARNKWTNDVVTTALKLAALLEKSGLDEYFFDVDEVHKDALKDTLPSEAFADVTKAQALIAEYLDTPYMAEFLRGFAEDAPILMESNSPLTKRPKSTEAKRAYFVRYLHEHFFMPVFGKPHFQQNATLTGAAFNDASFGADQARRLCES